MAIAPPKGRIAGTVALLLVAILTFAPGARADVGETIIQRCTHGQSLAGFRPSDYTRALNELSADTEEYTDCSALIRAAQLAATGAVPGGLAAAAASAVPLPTTPAERQAIAQAAVAGAAPVQVGGKLVRPGVVPVNIASALGSLPTPLLATIAFLLGCLAVVVGGAVRNRVRAHRSD